MTSCPTCGSVEQLFKASALILTETSLTNIGITSSDGTQHASVSGISTSFITQKARPPKKPASDSAGAGGGIFAAFVFSTFFFYFAFMNSNCKTCADRNNLTLWVLGTCFLFLAIYFLFQIPKYKTRDKITLAKYEKELQKWHRMWICKRCGSTSYTSY
jgi:hypothetical protein